MGRFASSGLVSAAAVASLWSSGNALRKAKRQVSAQLAGVPLYRAESHGLADQWMVAFGKEATDATLEEFCSQNGPCKAMGHPDEGGIPYVVVKAPEKVLESSIAAHRSSVAYVEQDAEAEDFVDEASAPEDVSWGVSAVGVQYASNKGRGVNVYVLDSGVRVSHSDFGGRAIPLYDAYFSPPKVCDGTDMTCAGDDRGHGTHVAGSVGGTAHGVAPESTLWAMQRGRSLGDGYGCIDWLVQNRQTPAVLQMSWGTASLSETARAAVDAAVAAMITTVVASGNSNHDACIWTFAGIPNAIAVESTDSSNARSSFSNYGPCIDILAPGSAITAADHRSDDGLSVKSGTSMASPHVAGGAALVLENNPGMSPAEVLQELQSNSLKNYISDAQSGNNFFLWVGGSENMPPTPAPTPPPLPGTWVLTGTGCEMDGNCIQSKNYPSNYGNSEACSVELYGEIPLAVDGDFMTEGRYDKLRVSGAEYHGTPPANVAELDGAHTGTLSWSSDSAHTNKGWRICRTDVPTPVLTPVPTQEPTPEPTLPTPTPGPAPDRDNAFIHNLVWSVLLLTFALGEM